MAKRVCVRALDAIIRRRLRLLFPDGEFSQRSSRPHLDPQDSRRSCVSFLLQAPHRRLHMININVAHAVHHDLVAVEVDLASVHASNIITIVSMLDSGHASHSRRPRGGARRQRQHIRLHFFRRHRWEQRRVLLLILSSDMFEQSRCITITIR